MMLAPLLADGSFVLGGVLQDVMVVTCRVVFFLAAVLLMVIVLLQEGKGGGLASALGGQGAETFGVATGGVNKVTLWLAGIFLVAALGHTMAHRSAVEELRNQHRQKPGATDRLPPIKDLTGGGGEDEGGGEAPAKRDENPPPPAPPAPPPPPPPAPPAPKDETPK